jgi:hypothetical protein
MPAQMNPTFPVQLQGHARRYTEVTHLQARCKQEQMRAKEQRLSPSAPSLSSCHALAGCTRHRLMQQAQQQVTLSPPQQQPQE